MDELASIQPRFCVSPKKNKKGTSIVALQLHSFIFIIQLSFVTMYSLRALFIAALVCVSSAFAPPTTTTTTARRTAALYAADERTYIMVSLSFFNVRFVCFLGVCSQTEPFCSLFADVYARKPISVVGQDVPTEWEPTRLSWSSSNNVDLLGVPYRHKCSLCFLPAN